jgi:hypothetical protein
LGLFKICQLIHVLNVANSPHSLAKVGVKRPLSDSLN